MIVAGQYYQSPSTGIVTIAAAGEIRDTRIIGVIDRMFKAG
jgi:hypothetical protein